MMRVAQHITPGKGPERKFIGLVQQIENLKIGKLMQVCLQVITSEKFGPKYGTDKTN